MVLPCVLRRVLAWPQHFLVMSRKMSVNKACTSHFLLPLVKKCVTVLRDTLLLGKKLLMIKARSYIGGQKAVTLRMCSPSRSRLPEFYRTTITTTCRIREEFLFLKIFIYLFGCAWSLSCSVWDLVPWPRIEPRTPALGAWSLSHWTTRGVPRRIFKSTPYCFGCFK